MTVQVGIHGFGRIGRLVLRSKLYNHAVRVHKPPLEGRSEIQAMKRKSP